jgi:hypothetical protein
VTIDIQNEELLTLKQAAQFLPNRPHIATLIRWWQRGCRGVKLTTILIGGQRYTSKEALQRFIEQTTAAADGAPAPRAESSKAREKRLAKVEAELSAAGI